VDSESAWRTGPSTRHWTAWTSRRHSLHPPTRRLILRRIASLYPRPKQLSWIGHGPVEKCRWAMTLWYPKRRIFWRNFHLYIPSNQCWIRITSLLAAMGSPPRAAWYACAPRTTMRMPSMTLIPLRSSAMLFFPCRRPQNPWNLLRRKKISGVSACSVEPMTFNTIPSNITLFRSTGHYRLWNECLELVSKQFQVQCPE